LRGQDVELEASGLAPRIESDDLSLDDLFKDFYAVPDFQREFVWKPENVEKLLDDILDAFYDGEKKLVGDTEYFIGSIVTCRDAEGVFQLIDGQQRLTSIYLTLCAIRDLLVGGNRTPSESLRGKIAAVSMNPKTGGDVFRYRVALQYEDSAGILDKIAAGPGLTDTVAESTASVCNILAAYRAIRVFLETNFDNDPVAIGPFLGALVSRVKLIRIVTPNLAHALKVFETINDRGVGLDSMDLLKNLLFIRTQAKDYAKLKAGWKVLVDTLDGCKEKPLRFLRYYIMSQFSTDWRKALREDEIYKWFVTHADECDINSEPLRFLASLRESARAYAHFIAGKNVSGTPNRYLRNIARLSGAARQHFILLLAAQRLPEALFTVLCRHIENVFFCYLITREPTKSFERSFAKWSSQLRSVKNQAALEGFIAGSFAPDLASRSRDFDFAMAELGESRIQQYRLRYVLAKLTQFIEERAWANPAHSDLDYFLAPTVQVEHVLPQHPAAGVKEGFDKPDGYGAYAGRLGNLMLLEQTINGSVSNHAFAEKAPGYRESKFLLTSSVVEKPQVGADTALNRAVADLEQYSTWTSQTIEARQASLGTLARAVWEIPSSSDETGGV
jgi:hypothetical protein